MKAAAALLLALAATNQGQAAIAYVTDELVLGVYASQSTLGPRLATLHSGAAVDTLASSGDATQVRLADGTTGWVKSAYLVSSAPATVRIKQLQEELDRRLATPLGLAEAAERSEVERLTRELAKQPGAAGAGASAEGKGGAGSPGTANGGAVGVRAAGPATSRAASFPWRWCLAVGGALGVGFWLGYATLARRVKLKFGGIKVY